MARERNKEATIVGRGRRSQKEEPPTRGRRGQREEAAPARKTRGQKEEPQRRARRSADTEIQITGKGATGRRKRGASANQSRETVTLSVQGVAEIPDGFEGRHGDRPVVTGSHLRAIRHLHGQRERPHQQELADASGRRRLPPRQTPCLRPRTQRTAG